MTKSEIKMLGKGPPLLLVNGYAASRDDWDPTFLDSLASASTVYCPDNRGIGSSPAGEEKITIRQMAEDMVVLLDGLGIDEVSVVGWSMGGFISQELAAMIPNRVNGLVLMATDPGGNLAEQRDPDVHRRLTDHTGTPHEQADRLLNLLFPPAMASDIYDQFGDIVAAAQAKLDLEVLRAQEAAMLEWATTPSEDRLAAISAPALALAGTEDVVIPPKNAETISRHLPNSWLARFPGCAHALMAQEPKRIGGLINTFLGRC